MSFRMELVSSCVWSTSLPQSPQPPQPPQRCAQQPGPVIRVRKPSHHVAKDWKRKQNPLAISLPRRNARCGCRESWPMLARWKTWTVQTTHVVARIEPWQDLSFTSNPKLSDQMAHGKITLVKFL